MKFLLLGDVHLRAGNPSSRKDDFQRAQWNKMLEVFNFAAAHQLPIISTGDLFDRPDTPYAVVVKYLSLFAKHKYGFYVVPGNHDIYGTNLSTVSRSALGVLEAARVVTILSHVPTDILGVRIYGTSYMHQGQLPQPSRDTYNILVVHDMILQDKIWKEQDDFHLVEDYLNDKRGWNLIVCGHYHYRFVYTDGVNLAINPGAVSRVKASKGDLDLLPGFIVFETEAPRKYQLHVLEAAQPADDVFELGGGPQVSKPESSGIDAQLESLVQRLMGEQVDYGGDLGLVINKVLAELKCSEVVSDLVKATVAEAQGMI